MPAGSGPSSVRRGGAKREFVWANNLYLLKIDGTDQRFLADSSLGSGSGWSPDGQYLWIEYCTRTGSCTFDLRPVETGAGGGCSGFYAPKSHSCISECFSREMSDGKWWSYHLWWSPMMVVSSRERTWALCPDFDLTYLAGAFDLTGALLSPDEGWIAFIAYDVSRSEYGQYIARSDGNELRPLYASFYNEVCIGEAAWSPDSQHFVFARYQDGETTLWLARPNSDSVTLFTHFESEACPRRLGWSADGRYIGISNDIVPGYDRKHRYIVSWPSGNLTRLPLDEFPDCEWSPDGNWLACVNSDLAAVYSIADDERIDLVMAQVNKLEWSPGGRWLAFSTDKEPFNRDEDEGIYIFDLVTGESIQIANERAEALAWSPVCE